MPSKRAKIRTRTLIGKARAYGVENVKKLSNKALLKIVNRHNINKKLVRIFKTLSKKAVFTNKELDNAIDLNELSHGELKEIAKRRMIKNYGVMSQNKLYYTLVKSDKSPLEDSYLKHLKVTLDSDIDARINHIRLLTTKLDNKLTNIERAEIYEELNELKKKYDDAAD